MAVNDSGECSRSIHQAKVPAISNPKMRSHGGQTVMAKLVGRYTTGVPTAKSVGPNLTKRSAITRRRGLLHMGASTSKRSQGKATKRETRNHTHQPSLRSYLVAPVKFLKYNFFIFEVLNID